MNNEHSTGSSVSVHDQRAHQREHHGVGHRLEQRSGRARQHIDRQEAGDDHGDRVEQRPVDFRGRIADDLQQLDGCGA